MKTQKSLDNDTKKKKRRILLGVLIPVGIIGIALATALPLTLCHKNKKIMPWDEVKDYFRYDNDGEMEGFRKGNGSTEECDFLKVCTKKGYTGVEFGSEITSIGTNAFSGCAGFGHGSPIKDMFITSAVSIGYYAFQGCASITSVGLGSSSPISIGDNAFEGCASLTSISPATTNGDITVSSIGYCAFQGCAGFTGITGTGKLIVTHTAGVDSIGSSAFEGCASLSLDFIQNMYITEAKMADDSTVLNHGGDANYAYICPTGFDLGTDEMCLTGSGCLIAGSIPASALTSPSIGDNAFEGCASITSVGLGSSSPFSIGQYAFQGCASLSDFIFV